jgi:hypothetical protein
MIKIKPCLLQNLFQADLGIHHITGVSIGSDAIVGDEGQENLFGGLISKYDFFSGNKS